jgi:hypothetical protein
LLPVRGPDLELFFARYFFDLQALHMLLLGNARHVVRHRVHASLRCSRCAVAHD